MEGVVFNPNAPEYVYLAMSNIDRAMTDGQGDIDVSDNFCGIVYRMTMVDEWDINRIDPVIIGGRTPLQHNTNATTTILQDQTTSSSLTMGVFWSARIHESTNTTLFGFGESTSHQSSKLMNKFS